MKTRAAVAIGVSLLWALLSPAARAQEQQRPDSGAPIPIDPSFSKVANETGGQVYVLDRSHAGDMAKIMQMTSLGDREELLSVNDRLDGSSRTYHVSVDPDMALLMLSVTGTTDFTLQRPNGSAVGKQENVVQYMEIRNGAIYTIQNPEPGDWTATLRGMGDVSIRANVVRSTQSDAVQFDLFRFVELGGRIGHEGMFPIQGYPLAEREWDVEARLDGEVAAVHFEFRDPGGEVLASFKLRKLPEDSQEYAGKVKVPAAPFVVYAVGVDMHGAPFQRVRPGQIRPQSFRVQAPSYWELKAGQAEACTVKVTNYGPQGSFRVLIADPNRLVRDVNPMTFALNTGDSADVTLNVQPPADGKLQSESLVVTLQRTDNSQTNFASIMTTVMAP